MKRRDFLKGIGAALAGLFVSRQEPEADPLEPYDPSRQYVVPRLRDCPGETVTAMDGRELEMHFTVVAESIECLPNGGTVYNNCRLKDSAGETA
jgi:hypothetical protein